MILTRSTKLNPKEAIVPEKIRYIDHYYVTVPHKPGEASRVLGALQQERINLLGLSAFIHRHRSQPILPTARSPVAHV